MLVWVAGRRGYRTVSLQLSIVARLDSAYVGARLPKFVFFGHIYSESRFGDVCGNIPLNCAAHPTGSDLPAEMRRFYFVVGGGG